MTTDPLPTTRASVALSWSGGKDSALALHALRDDPARRVVVLVTTVTAGVDRISTHGVQRALLRAQARSLGIELVEVEIPPECSNAEYEAEIRRALVRLGERGVREIAFGDLHLADLRAYRDRLVAGAGLVAHYPIWGRDPAALARQCIDLGFRARLVCVDRAQIDPELCGRAFDDALLAALPAGADPCGENGEFHTFVHDGPLFRWPIRVEAGAQTDRDGFRYCDLRAAPPPPADARPTTPTARA